MSHLKKKALWRVRVTIVTVEEQNVYCCQAYVIVNSITNTESVPMERQQLAPLIVALHTPLPR
jgi:hypothetical protein